MIAIVAALSVVSAKITVYPDQPTLKVSPDLYGIFFEEINCAGDGGIYAELIRNRSFEDSTQPEHWTLQPGSSGSIKVETRPGEGHNARHLSLTSTREASIANGGYWGMNVENGQTYQVKARTRGTSYQVRLEDEGGRVLASTMVTASPSWSDQTVNLRATGSSAKARFVISLATEGQLDVDFISLLPTDGTGKPRAIRQDLFQALKGLKPAFLRFPGGCWVEGETMDRAQRWKQTIGPEINRRTQPNIWGYQSTNGLGYHEYLQLCEDLSAAAMFVVNCGMSHKEVIALDKMDEFVQDALDAIEYANGPVTSKWGAERAKNGHPKPFNLKYLEIGNENGGPAYEERYALIYNAVKARYPEIITIANVWGGTPKKTPMEVIDEHYYSNPDFFIQNANRYDSYDRKGPKVYVGEYAVTQGCGNGNLIAAVAEAAFMTGMERNSDHVIMASYAPLFANLNLKAWNPDLIYFNSSQSVMTPSYYVQQMFAQNRPHEVVRTEVVQEASVKETFPSGGIGVGTWNTQAEFKDIRVTQGAKVLYMGGGKEFKPESGKWTMGGEITSQSGNEQPARAWFGDRNWKNYTMTLKARRVSRAEGFLITVGRTGPNDYIWLNLGGWGNTQHALEWSKAGGKSMIGRPKPGSIPISQWCDVRVDYREDRIICFVEGKQIFDEAVPTSKDLHVTAGRDQNKVILKVVNTGKRANQADIKIPRLGAFSVETLTGSGPLEENSLAAPRRVIPKTSSGKTAHGSFRHTFPPYSLTIIRSK